MGRLFQSRGSLRPGASRIFGCISFLLSLSQGAPYAFILGSFLFIRIVPFDWSALFDSVCGQEEPIGSTTRSRKYVPMSSSQAQNRALALLMNQFCLLKHRAAAHFFPGEKTVHGITNHNGFGLGTRPAMHDRIIAEYKSTLAVAGYVGRMKNESFPRAANSQTLLIRLDAEIAQQLLARMVVKVLDQKGVPALQRSNQNRIECERVLVTPSKQWRHRRASNAARQEKMIEQRRDVHSKIRQSRFTGQGSHPRVVVSWVSHATTPLPTPHYPALRPAASSDSAALRPPPSRGGAEWGFSRALRGCVDWA